MWKLTAPIPNHLHGQERITWMKARTDVQRREKALFPPDEDD